MSRARLYSAEVMGAFLGRIRDCNRGVGFRSTHVPFEIDGKCYGYVTPQDYERFIKHPNVFVPSSSKEGRPLLRLAPSVEQRDVMGRTEAVEAVMQELRGQKALGKCYNEYFPVCDTFSSPPVMLVDRSAYSIMGIRGYGVHINGFVKTKDEPSQHKLWVAKRSATKSTYPNKFDCLVGGGQPYGISLMENVVKECMEEASIPESIARTAVCSGAITYTDADASGRLGRDVLFCYDLELAEDFVPRPCDGEVQSFELKCIDWVVDTIVARRSDHEFKPNINVTIIDFLIRHGYICNSSPGYLEMLAALRGDDCM